MGTYESSEVDKAIDRHDYTIAELAELRAEHARLVSLARDVNAELEKTIHLQQRLRAVITRALGDKPRPVAGMAVWDAAEAEKR